MIESDVDQTIDSGLALIKSEMNRLSKKNKTKPMEPEDVQNLNTFMRLLLAMKKETRDASVEEDLSKLDMNELSKIAEQALKYTKEKK